MRRLRLISVSATKINNHIIVSVQDDGIGVPESVSFENSTGFGLQLIYALAQQLEGSIRIERGNGARVVLEFDM
jgi:two-component sensor histidine kinase